MPRISSFYGIVIYMYYNEHAPPHFHAKYSGQEAIIDIRALNLLNGKLPSRALGMVIEWASIHQNELLINWERSEKLEPLLPIPPL